MARDKGNPTPPLYIELMDGESDKITIPASTIFDIHLKLNQSGATTMHSKVVVVRLNPDNSRSSIIAMFQSGNNPYHQSAATSYYERLTALIGAIRLNTWNKSDKPDPDMI
jgi:hypothetical protein